MKKNSNIILVVSSLAVVGVLGYLLMRQLRATQKAKSEKEVKKEPVVRGFEGIAKYLDSLKNK
jgi:hypothetical protein